MIYFLCFLGGIASTLAVGWFAYDLWCRWESYQLDRTQARCKALLQSQGYEPDWIDTTEPCIHGIRPVDACEKCR